MPWLPPWILPTRSSGTHIHGSLSRLTRFSSLGWPRAVADILKGRVDLCGVRVTRGSPVVFVDPAGCRLDPFQLVVVALPEGEALAMVVVAPGQILQNEAQAGPRGRVIRVASEGDIAAFRQGDNAGLDPMSRVRPQVEGAGLPPGWSDWLVPPGDQPSVSARSGTDAERCSARAFIDRLFPEPPGPTKQ